MEGTEWFRRLHQVQRSLGEISLVNPERTQATIRQARASLLELETLPGALGQLVSSAEHPMTPAEFSDPEGSQGQEPTNAGPADWSQVQPLL